MNEWLLFKNNNEIPWFLIFQKFFLFIKLINQNFIDNPLILKYIFILKFFKIWFLGFAF